MSQAAVNRDKDTRFALNGFPKHPVVLAVIIAVVTYAILFTLILTSISPKRYDLEAGDISAESIAATRDVEDKIATQIKIDEARDRVLDIYTHDNTITAGIISDVENTFEGIFAARSSADKRIRDWEEEQAQLDSATEEEQDDSAVTEDNVDTEIVGDTENVDISVNQLQEGSEIPIRDILDEEYLQTIRANIPISLSDDDILTLIRSDESELDQLSTILVITLTEMLESGIKREQLAEFRNSIRDEILSLPVSNDLKVLGSTIGVTQLKANLLHDIEKTMNERDNAEEQVERVIFKKAQFIVQAGQPVTDQQIAILSELGLLKDEHIDITMIAGLAIILLLIQGIIIMYFYYFEKSLLIKPDKLLMISLITCLVLILNYIASIINIYFIVTPMSGLLLAILIKPRIGIAVNVATALLAGIMAGSQLGIVLMALLGGMVGICMVNSLQQRNTLVWAGLGISAVSVLTILSFEMVLVGGFVSSFYNSLWGLMGGMSTAVLTIGTMPIWENLFSVVTPIKLMELANPNHPVLKRLLMETPGTYHHSIIVANLAENAADAVGANGLLARVGAYYHDIGKLERPYYFKENQLYTENPHDRLAPRLSTKIITSHTLDGITLAKRYRVPKILHDFILQHHGTTPVIYFFHKAKSDEEGSDVKLSDFRYVGPKPNRRETAIVMMADTVEAAVRSLSNPTPDSVETLIRKLIKDKLDDGQFDDSELSIKDLNTIAVTFSSVISGIFHERVKYPDVDLSKEKGEHEDDSADRE